MAWYNRRTYPFFHNSALITSGPVTGYITNTEFKLRYNHTNNRKRQQTKRSKNMNPSGAAHQAVSPNEIYIDQTPADRIISLSVCPKNSVFILSSIHWGFPIPGLITTRRRQSKAAMRWNGFWTSASARTCFSAMPRKPAFTF